MPASRRILGFALVAVLAGVAAIVVARWNPGASNAPPESDEPPPPCLAFDPPAVELGTVLPGQKLRRTVRVRNTGTETVTIERAMADCGCTTPIWPTQPIPPNGEADAEVIYEAGSSQGIEIRKRITFIVPHHGLSFLPVNGRVGEFVRLDVTAIDAPAQVAPGSVSAPLTFESADGTAFRVTAAEPAVVLDAPAQPAARATVHVDWAAWERAGRPIQVTITTDHPKAPPFRVVVRRPLQPAGAPAAAPSPAAPSKPTETPDPDAMPGP